MKFLRLNGVRHMSSVKELYKGHIPLSFFEKSQLAICAGLQVLKDPTRQDLVAALGETTGHLALRNMKDQMYKSREGRKILKERPIIHSSILDIDRLALLKEGTFGREYLRFLEDNKVSPDTRTDVHYVDDEELAYVMLRYRQTHDFYHALTGVPITIEGELLLKWFELAQFQLPMNLLSVLIGPTLLDNQGKEFYTKERILRAIQCGANAKFLLNVKFEDCFERDIHEFRKELGVFLI